MTLDECMSRREIIGEYDRMEVTYCEEKRLVSKGDQFGSLTVTNLVKYREGSVSRKGCICQCECGEFVGPSRLRMLFDGDLTSCGCECRRIHSQMMSERNFKHGHSKEKLYTIWGALKDRVKNHNRKDAKYYSDKGIGISPEWENDYLSFRRWSMDNGYKDGLTIDRIDGSKGYSPENCRWVDMTVQNNNKESNVRIEYNGSSYSIREMSEMFGIPIDNFYDRRCKGWSVDRIISTPVKFNVRRNDYVC